MKTNKYILLAALSLTITACTSVTVIPEAKDKRTILSNASSSEKAVKIAAYKANRTCSLEGKSMQIIEIDAIYQGLNEKQSKLVKKAQTVLPAEKTSGHYIPPDFLYKGKLTFKCI